jgi:dTDP-4-dehydrorhamnose 3,5-epimerase
MKFSQTKLPGVLIVEPDIIGDKRGFFFVTFQAHKFTEAGIKADFIQDNHSGSQKGTLRGLHYQIRYSQGKLIRVIAGEIFDVAVDIRQSSPSFGKWVGVRLSADNKNQLWVPEGFAHGFYVITDWAEVVYKVTDVYAPEWERTIAWDDPEIGIEWPIPKGTHPLLSEKDLQGKSLPEADLFE